MSHTPCQLWPRGLLHRGLLVDAWVNAEPVAVSASGKIGDATWIATFLILAIVRTDGTSKVFYCENAFCTLTVILVQ